ncbi:hypothetical protein CRE_31011 [Caenorhabditis remanei]|uniref:Uncharacterized protein n=1 Tax=Caenorhabditis remanei TaxID=31234 RepID=E3LU38_CAERE|nr:hypothetical protein CRE_31011 [Caenorhabditis remanei]
MLVRKHLWVYFLSIHFIVDTFPEQLGKLKGIRLVVLFIPCLICFIGWFEFIDFAMPNTVEKQELMRETIMNYYEENIRNSSFIGAIYYTVEQNRERKWRITDVMGYLGCIQLQNFVW